MTRFPAINRAIFLSTAGYSLYSIESHQLCYQVVVFFPPKRLDGLLEYQFIRGNLYFVLIVIRSGQEEYHEKTEKVLYYRISDLRRM